MVTFALNTPRAPLPFHFHFQLPSPPPPLVSREGSGSRGASLKVEGGGGAGNIPGPNHDDPKRRHLRTLHGGGQGRRGDGHTGWSPVAEVKAADGARTVEGQCGFPSSKEWR